MKLVARKEVVLETQDFPDHARNQFWYIGIGLLVAAFIYLAIYQQDYLSAVVALVVGIAIFRLATLKPSAKKVVVGSSGLQWGDRHFAFHQLKAFWTDVVSGQKTIYVEPVGMGSLIVIASPDSSFDTVVQILSDHLPFHPHRQEPLTDKFSRFFRL